MVTANRANSGLLLVILTAMASVQATLAADTPRGAPSILSAGYPRVFFFRAAEGTVRYARGGYDDWDATFSRLMGIMGKCLDEEVLGLDQRNPEFFSRFKQQHPEQVVLLHFNGNSRDPRYHTERYWPGHWIYRAATNIAADVPAEAGQTTIRVADARDFRVETGRYRTSTDDIALFGVTVDGRHDWSHCEQVQLVSVDAKANSIVVRRGCYGTKPLAFAAGRSRAAAHAVEGPWGKRNNLLWFYNYSTHCPPDPSGRTCSDLLVDDLASWFGAGGKLVAFDGLEFDVLYNVTHGDTDGDGVIDDGVVGGINRYGIGVVEFAGKLRARMGKRFIIQADGALGPGGSRSQRAWGFLNGIESEGWPNLNDWDFNDWSGGLNRHNFWQANARASAFHYFNHKWVEPVPDKPGEHVNALVPFARHRLAFAAAQFTGAAVCYSLPPAADADGRLGIWDEFRQGIDQRLGWLGDPLEPAVHLAAQTPDLLAGGNWFDRVHSDSIQSRDAGGITLVGRRREETELRFTVPAVPVSGGDVVVLARMRGQPQQGYPATMARYAELELSGGCVGLLGRSPDEVGMALREGNEGPIVAGCGAAVLYRPREAIGETSLAAYAVHPPYRNGVGYVYWCRDVDVAAGSDLCFSLGMGEKSPERSDGIWFQVWAAELRDGRPGNYARLFERSTKAHEWIACKVGLDQFAGKRVRLKFVADCGPRNNATTDHGYWGDVRLVDRSTPAAEGTPAMSRMTWVNQNAFDSVFYFRGVRSRQVRLAFRIEGAEPLTIERLSVYAAPDAMYRQFEHGLVLANPGLAPYTFDLSKLAPGIAYRRLKASAGQDGEANDGRPVDSRVTIEGRDALFLVRR